MPGTGSADLTAETVAGWGAVPTEARARLEAASGFFGSAAWWSVVTAHAMPPGGEPVFVLLRYAGRLAGIVPMLRQGPLRQSLTTPYTCCFVPWIADDLPVPALKALAHVCRTGAAVTRLDALPAEWPHWRALSLAARQAGLRALPFQHFGNWSEAVGGLGWEAYLRLRPGALRETVRRRLRRTEAGQVGCFEMFTDRAEQAAEIFESVYRRSWKQPEPYPSFNAALIRAAAAAGWLRLGVWSVGEQPVAVQFWVVHGGHATVLKLAHDEAFKAHSPGTLLTALMLRHLLDTEQVARIDFGRGDDAYKRSWASERRQRLGVLLVDPLRPRGLAALLRHQAGRVLAHATSAGTGRDAAEKARGDDSRGVEGDASKNLLRDGKAA